METKEKQKARNNERINENVRDNQKIMTAMC